MEKIIALEKNDSKNLYGYLLAFFAIFIWGITFVCTKHLLNYFSAFEILVIRFVMAYTILA